MRERAAEHEKRGEEKQGKEIVSNYGGLFEGGGKYDTIGIWKEK